MDVKSRVPGKVMDIKVNVGDAVKVKDVLVVMEAMKMKQLVPAPVEGTVKEIKVKVGDRVSPGSVILVLK